MYKPLFELIGEGKHSCKGEIYAIDHTLLCKIFVATGRHKASRMDREESTR